MHRAGPMKFYSRAATAPATATNRPPALPARGSAAFVLEAAAEAPVVVLVGKISVPLMELEASVAEAEATAAELVTDPVAVLEAMAFEP